MSQKEIILNALKQGWVTAMTIANQGITTKLTSRVSDYRKQGYKIMDRWVEPANGKPYKTYRLVK